MLDVQEGGYAGEEVLAECGVPGDDVGVTPLFDVFHQQGSVVLREALVVGGVVDGDDFFYAGDFGGLFGDGLDGAAGEEGVDSAAEFLGGGDGGEGACVELAVALFEDGEGGEKAVEGGGSRAEGREGCGLEAWTGEGREGSAGGGGEHRDSRTGDLLKWCKLGGRLPKKGERFNR